MLKRRGFSFLRNTTKIIISSRTLNPWYFDKRFESTPLFKSEEKNNIEERRTKPNENAQILKLHEFNLFILGLNFYQEAFQIPSEDIMPIKNCEKNKELYFSFRHFISNQIAERELSLTTPDHLILNYYYAICGKNISKMKECLNYFVEYYHEFSDPQFFKILSLIGYSTMYVKNGEIFQILKYEIAKRAHKCSKMEHILYLYFSVYYFKQSAKKDTFKKMLNNLEKLDFFYNYLENIFEKFLGMLMNNALLSLFQICLRLISDERFISKKLVTKLMQIYMIYRVEYSIALAPCLLHSLKHFSSMKLNSRVERLLIDSLIKNRSSLPIMDQISNVCISLAFEFFEIKLWEYFIQSDCLNAFTMIPALNTIIVNRIVNLNYLSNPQYIYLCQLHVILKIIYEKYSKQLPVDILSMKMGDSGLTYLEFHAILEKTCSKTNFKKANFQPQQVRSNISKEVFRLLKNGFFTTRSVVFEHPYCLYSIDILLYSKNPNYQKKLGIEIDGYFKENRSDLDIFEKLKGFIIDTESIDIIRINTESFDQLNWLILTDWQKFQALIKLIKERSPTFDVSDEEMILAKKNYKLIEFKKIARTVTNYD